LAAALGIGLSVAEAQPYLPGTTYFGRSNYIEYTAGDLPFIMSAPHGGTLNPTEIPDRTNCTTCSGWDFSTATDTATDDVARRVLAELGKLTGHLPHIVICRLDRNKIDCNREVGEGAQGDPEAVIAWNEFQDYINSASNNVITNFGKGFYIDQHGQGHPEGRLELGYLLDKYELTNSDSYMDSHPSSFKNTSSIRTLANSVSNVMSFSRLLRGTNSFGEFMVNEGYPATPSFTTPMPFATPTSSSNFFNGGYNTLVHGSIGGGPLSALQIEANYTGVRDTASNRLFYAQAVARTLEKFFAQHYGINLRTCAPTIWDVGSGTWNTNISWALNILPVSSNTLVFAGSGGTSTHNLSALTSGTGVVSSLTFSDDATGAYTITGNAFTMIGGVTNDNAFTNVINDNVTLNVNVPFAINSGALTMGGVISGAGGFAKTGVGSLALSQINTCTGAVTNGAGVISLNATSTPGTGPFVLAGGDLAVLNSRSTAPLSNALVMTGNTTIYGTSTLTNSNRILTFSANNVTTPGGTLTIRNAGTNATATNNAFRVRFAGGGFNFTQPIVIGHAADLPALTSQLESYNDNVTADQTFSGVISGSGQFRRDASNAVAAGRTILTGANTYSGGTLVQAGTLLVNNAAGSGTGSGSVVVSNTGTLSGSGTIAGPVVCSGLISSAQGSGALTLNGGLDLSGGGTNLWELAAFTTTGEGTNFDQLVLTGGSLTLGGNSRLQLSFVAGATSPSGGDPFWQGVRSWKIISLSGSATNPGSTKFPLLLNGSFAAGNFTNFTDLSGSVWLQFVPTNAYARPLLSPNVAGINAGGATLQWSAVEGQTYQLQSKDDLAAPAWNVIGNVVAPGATASLTDTNATGVKRFYRVVIP
jgi:autotransporter-associated beta strand protein